MFVVFYFKNLPCMWHYGVSNEVGCNIPRTFAGNKWIQDNKFLVHYNLRGQWVLSGKNYIAKQLLLQQYNSALSICSNHNFTNACLYLVAPSLFKVHGIRHLSTPAPGELELSRMVSTKSPCSSSKSESNTSWSCS